MNVTLQLVQSQNAAKLQNAQAAIGIMAQYALLPETEKLSQRSVYVQALMSLGFQDAESIVRQAVTDPAGILALLPPEVAAVVQGALEAAGVMAPETAPGESPASADSAPVT